MIILDDHLTLGDRRFRKSAIEIVDRRRGHVGLAQHRDPLVHRPFTEDRFELRHELGAVLDTQRVRAVLRLVRKLGVAHRLAQAPLHGRGWAPLGSGLRAVYRRGRRRLPEPGSATSSEALHAWRRHAKRYWHVLERFAVVNPQRLAAEIRGARRLSELLGEEHDLAMLDQQICGKQSSPEPDDLEVLQAVAERRAKLTPRAMKLGNRIYAEKPKALERRMRDDWERWRKR